MKIRCDNTLTQNSVDYFSAGGTLPKFPVTEYCYHKFIYGYNDNKYYCAPKESYNSRVIVQLQQIIRTI